MVVITFKARKNKKKSQGSPLWWPAPYKLSSSARLMNPSGVWGKLLSSIRSYFPSKIKPFFSGRLSAFGVLFPNMWTARRMNHGTLLPALIQNNWKETAKKEWSWLHFGPEAPLFISSFTENLLSSLDLLSWQLNCFLLYSALLISLSHSAEQKEA